MSSGKINGFSPARFLREYWQKKPLLIRNAFPNFKEILNKRDLISLSANEDIQSRLVSSNRGKWKLSYGPFESQDFMKKAGNWTLLVQGLNNFLPEGQALLNCFNFIPHTRLDDLMVSFAPDGGGVGPHFDSYDVFLLQGKGKRLWQISAQADQSLIPDIQLRILENFKAEQEWVLEPGDMLYLPPNYAHNGVAIGESMTYSIGFRAPSYQELANQFLFYLQDQLELDGLYKDPELKVTKNPGQIPEAMINKISIELKKIRFGNYEIKEFLGKYLSEPKSHLFFDIPESPYKQEKFLKLAKKHGIILDLKSQLLFTEESFFINSESFSFHPGMKPILKKLSNEREVVLPAKINNHTLELLYEWYLNGYIHIKA